MSSQEQTISSQESNKQIIEESTSTNNKDKNKRNIQKSDIDIDIDIDDPRLPSICIPRLDLSITSEYIETIMNEVLLPMDTSLKTCIERIDILSRQNEKGEDFKRAFIHFISWTTFESTSSKRMREKLLSGEIVKIMYNYPYYWKCSASRVPRPEWNDHSPASIEKQRVKAFFVDDNTNSSSSEIGSEEEQNRFTKKSNLNKKKQNNYINHNNNKKKEISNYKPKWLGETVLDCSVNNNIHKKKEKTKVHQINKKE